MSVRSPMQWSGDAHGGFSTVEDPQALVRPLTDGRFGPERVNAFDQRRDPDSLLNWMERLIRRRRETPELGWGTYTALSSREPEVLAHRCDWDESAVVAVHNLAGHDVTTRLPLEGDATLVDLLAAADLAAPYELALEPYGYRWYRLPSPLLPGAP